MTPEPPRLKTPEQAESLQQPAVTPKSPDAHINIYTKQDEPATSNEPEKKKFFCCMLTKRNRWLLIGFILCCCIGFGIAMIYVIGTAFAQKSADQVELGLNYVDLLGVEYKDGKELLNVELSAHLKSDGPVGAKLYETEVTMFFGGKDFGTVVIPVQDIHRGKQDYDLVVRTTAQVYDSVTLSRMSAALVAEKSINMTISGDFSAGVWIFKFNNIKVTRTMPVRGMRKLLDSPPIVNSVTLEVCNKEKVSFNINVTIDNVSQMGLNGIGLLNMTIFYEQSFLGYALSSDPDRGLPRGAYAQVFHVETATTPYELFVIGQVINGVFTNNANFVVSGDNDYATTIKSLAPALKVVYLPVHYTDGVSKLQLMPDCIVSDMFGGSWAPDMLPNASMPQGTLTAPSSGHRDL